MLNQRLIFIFAAFVLIFCALGVRLVHLQVNEVDEWREKMRAYVHHQNKIETARGSIVDRNGVVVAFDDPCYDLAIDYRAMNLDDRWLGYLAGKKLKQETFTNKTERARRFAELKAEIAAKVDAIPDALATICDTSSLTDPSPDAPPREKIYWRFEEIRQRISILRQDYWSRAYDAETDKLKAAGGEAIDDAVFNEPLREERIAHTIIPHIPDAVASYFRLHADDYPGLVVVDSLTRRYPYKNVACQVLGTMRGVDGEAIKKNRFVLPNLLADNEPGNLSGYLPGDRMGEAGIEKLCEDQLRGTRGVVLIDEAAGPTTAPANASATETSSERRINPVVGKSVQLTLDIALQRDIEKALYDPSRGLLKGGDGLDHHVALVVLSLDGQVLSMVSTPGYDPNTIDDTRVDLIKAKFDRPLANRATEAYRPGSIVKPLIAAAALNDHVIDLQTTVNCVGHLFPGRPTIFKCAEVHGQVELIHAIAESCNIYFYNVGDKMGVDNLVRWFRLYGLDSDTGFELPDHGGRLKFREGTDTDTLRNEARFFGIGEGGIDSTPLQIANAYATLLRGGREVTPRILAATPVHESQSFTLAPGTLGIIKDAMRKTVTIGTAKETFRDLKLAGPGGPGVGGKTGTADVTNKPVLDENGEQAVDKDHPLTNRDGTPALGPNGERLYRKLYDRGTHSWFVAFTPVDRPKFVIVAFKEFAGYGGKYAAPIVKEAILDLERHGYLPPADVR
jgi:penicillin-binding protein 2